MNVFFQSLGVSEALNGDPNCDYVNRPNARNRGLRGLANTSSDIPIAVLMGQQLGSR